MIALIDALKEELPSKINLFSKKIAMGMFATNNYDVSLTTAHQAKGLEYDNVKILNDFVELEITRKWIIGSSETNKEAPKTQFKLTSWGDELNLWYVCCVVILGTSQPLELRKCFHCLPNFGDWWMFILMFLKLLIQYQ
jgi:hypothetical protein